MPALRCGRAPRHLRSWGRGFTAVELITVLIVFLIVAAIGIPRAGSVIQNFRLRGAAWQLASDLRLARQQAVTRRMSVRVCISGCAVTILTPIKAYSVEVYKGTPPAWVNETGVPIALPEDVVLTGNVNTVGFGSTGIADAGTFTVTNVQGCYQVTTSVMGQVQTSGICP